MNPGRFFTVFQAFLLLGLFSAKLDAQDIYNEKQIEVALRMIGHELLIHSGDSTSLVLPIEKLERTYQLSFGAELEIFPDSLISAVNAIAEKTNFAEAYIIEVLECDSSKVVYSYEILKQVDNSVGHCNARVLPRDCYTIMLSIQDKDVSEELSLVPTNPSGSGNSPKPFVPFLLTFLALGGIATYFITNKRRGQVKKEAHIIPLGAYQFDKRNTELILENRKIELTAKEAELLILLYDAANTTVEREHILSMVWGDQGDYVGRTLDVFISKLRKKLQDDSRVKIVNIRGVGYKLVMNV